MSELILGPRPEDFIWASGIEDTFVPQTRPGHRALDEYELIGHYEHWREDLALLRELGVQAVRWGVPWYRVEPQPGAFDWAWTDQVLPYLVEELGVTPIIDLMHYGCPFWLHREFANADYPAAVAAYTAAFARRYAGLVRWYTPLNEPLVKTPCSAASAGCGRRTCAASGATSASPCNWCAASSAPWRRSKRWTPGDHGPCRGDRDHPRHVRRPPGAGDRGPAPGLPQL